MYVILVVSLLILSHILTDFYIQNDDLVEKKKEKNLYIALHSFHFFICSVLLTIVFFSYSLLIIVALISVTHFIIDKLKIGMEIENNPSRSLSLFILDQLLHLSMIILFYPLLVDIKPNNTMNKLVEVINSNYTFLESLNNVDLLSFIILAIAGYLFIVKGGTILSLMIISLPGEKSETSNKAVQEITTGRKETAAAGAENPSPNWSVEEEKKKYGRIIGNIERVLIVSFLLISQHQAIAILIAVKSIGRFREMNNKSSDYYIIGNFASLSIAFFIGYLLVFAKKLLLQ